MSRFLGAIALGACTFAAAGGEVTVIRPTAHIAQEWAYYVLIDGKVLADVKTGERVTLPEPALTESWGQRLGSHTNLRVGITWQGNPTHPNDRRRSVPLGSFAPLAQLPGVQLVSLQKGPGEEQGPP